MNDHLLSCDWGTSTFRLLLLHTPTSRVEAVIQTDNGNAAMYQHWLDQGRPERASFYRSYLQQQVKALSRTCRHALEGLPLMLSGMSSSSIGLCELPYDELPFELDGQLPGHRYFEATNEFPNPIWVFTGLKSATDVMRGEEMQVLGLFPALPEARQTAICIFPGTHSKHIQLHAGRILDFHTYMTGEIFQLMGHHSILKASVEMAQTDNTGISPHFAQGVKVGAQTPLLNALFHVRSRQLLQGEAAADNAQFLSGLLIGSELSTLKDPKAAIVLCAGKKLSPHYRAALDALALPHRCLPASAVEQAVSSGHIRLAAALGICSA